jgi:hypothetical protein
MADSEALQELAEKVAALTAEAAAHTEQIELLKRKVSDLQDIDAVKCLHYKYGYYIDKCLYDEAVDLFSDEGAVRFLNGVYRGRAGARRLYCHWFRNYFTKGHNGPVRGFLLDHLLFQDIVDIAPDGLTAKGRFRCVLQGGCHESLREPIPNLPKQFWEAGIYENEYVKESGTWKIKLLNYNMLWQANYEEEWAHSGVHLPTFAKTFPQDPNGPDELASAVPKTWPETSVVPFHYPHPVTGKFWQQS